MSFSTSFARISASAALAAGIATASDAAFVSYVVVRTQVTTGGVLLDQYRVFARFNGPTDTVLNVFNLAYSGGATVADPYAAYYHKDNSSYNGGILSKQYGTWSPTLTGSATLNRPYDSFLTIGGTATPTNSTSADPSWNSGGSGSHAGGAAGWNRADLLNNGTMGWFNNSPPTLQGRVGVSPNTPTDVLICQFVVDRNANAGNWSLTVGYNDGVAGSAVQFATASFSLAPTCTNVRYPDSDNDGFGSPNSPVFTCVELYRYVSNNTDCNDSNAAINPNTVWARDLDGDGFGSTASGTLTQCTQPAGYVLSSADCNDSNAAINPNTVWTRDLDGDGFGSTASGTLTQCTQPAGYVLNNTDCNDSNAAINPNTVWARDLDGDGFGSTASGTLSQCTQPAGYVLNNTDCNDSDATINPNTIWTRDLDGDGFGSTASGTTAQCTQPTGYVRNNSDCNDADATINPNTVWTRDLDGDGFGSTASGTTAQCTQPTGYVRNNSDCNDSNAAINPNTVWTRDLDGDGFGSTGDGTLVQCTQPAGFVLNNTDNCPGIANPSQADCNANGIGDACEALAGNTATGWGDNANGQTTVPPSLTNAVQLAAGGFHSIARKSNGTVVAWGKNEFGQINIPAGLGSTIDVAAGIEHSVAARSDGTAAAWGWNAFGQATVPAGLTAVAQVAAGFTHSAARKTDGTVVCWGGGTTNTGVDPNFGQSIVPAGLVTVTDIAAGAYHTIARRSNGTLVIWGFNAYGQTNVPAGQTFRRAVGGVFHTVAIRSDGLVSCWGENQAGQCTVPSDLGPVTAVAAGYSTSYAIKLDGSIAAWGLNDVGQRSVPSALGTFSGIAAGYKFALAQRAVSTDCNSNGTPDSCEIATGASRDCNSNGLLDSCELAAGTLFDCDSDGIADVCEGGLQVTRPSALLAPLGNSATLSYTFTGLAASRGNGVRLTIDALGDLESANEFIGLTFDGGTIEYFFVNGASNCTVGANRAIRTFTNAQFNALVADGTLVVSIVPSPTVSATECAESYVRLTLDYTALGTGSDCNNNGLLDSCEIGNGLVADCNTNGILDTCELASGAATDCNGNGTLDSCDLAAGTSTDLNNNGRLDECSGEFVVGGSGYATIAAAISAAPSGAQIDVGPGTYTGAISITTKSIKLKSIAGAAQTILSGSGLDASIIAIRTTAANGTVVDGFTLRDGPVGTAEFGTRLGGAIVCIQTTATIRNCRFLNNTSAYGGAIYAYDLSGSIDHCLFEANHATVGAGALQVGFGGTVDLNFNDYINNSAALDGGAVGVVQWFEGPITTATIRNSQFRGNSAPRYGGALTWWAGLGVDLAITNCTVESNSSSGPVFARLAESTSTTLRFAIQGSRFCLNSAGNVGGPLLDQGGNTFSQDCNANGICDADEIASGAQQDCNGNGLPDSCELGRIFAWGENNFGQTTVPSSLRRTRDISAGCNHVLAINENRQVVAWGSNSFGQRAVPASVTAVLAVAAGCDHSLALRTDGSVAAWGYNGYGQTNVPAGANGSVAQIAAGANHSGVRKTNGSLVLWGRNADGECNVPAGIGSVSKLALGGAHSMGLRSDGTLVCWGLNNFGQCNIPAIGGAVIDIAAGCYHSVGLRSDGTVRAWGSSIFGQTSVPAGLSDVIKIAAGSSQHTVALRSNGTVVSWGWNAFGQTAVPAAVNGVSQISAGGTSSVASAPGTVDCNANGVVDSCEIASGAASDCNANGTPDACELVDGTATDCDNNNRLDSCDLALGAADCNGNARPDSCDLAAGTSTDLNSNGKPDECPGEFVVGGSGFPTIQAALSAAVDGSVINIGSGTYSGPIAIDSKRVTLRSINGPSSVTLSGSGLSTSILTIRSAASNGTLIEGITFRDGPIGTAEFGFRLGGAIYCNNTTASIHDCRFYNNSSEYGGAIYALNLTGTISNCVFDGNHAIVDAGAVQVGYGGVTTLVGNEFRNNTAGRNGGAVQVVQGETPPLSSSSISNSVFSSNTAAVYAAAISWSVGLGGNLPISGCTIESNSSTGAVVARVPGSTSTTARFVVTNSRFCLNTGGNLDGPLTDNGGNTFSQDCNANGICDADEIAALSVPDCDHDGFPDSCQLGKAIAWGENAAGQASVPAALGAPREISAGCTHAIAIRSDRSVLAWGSNSFGQAQIPPGLTGASQIAAGCDHNLALRTDGALFAWGYNAFGQCNIPSAANGNIAQVAAGANHSGVRKTDGSLVLWGRNASNECTVPPALGVAIHLSLGGAHSVALRYDGRPYCWGLDNFGQCNVPAAALTLKDITAGCYHTVGVRPDGTVRAWGSNLFGQTSVPVGLSGVKRVVAGSSQHTLALLDDGSVIAWGWNNFGQSTIPSAVNTTVGGIAAGGTFSMVRTSTSFDCNGNGAIDSCELAGGTALDCNNNGTIDSCDIASGAAPDCNANGVPDSCDIANGAAPDCDSNGKPDSCDIASGAAPDCNGNGKPDSCDIASGFSPDCNGNGRPDTCDLASGASTDLNGNGKPDECAGEWIVGGSGYASIQAAINAASNGTTIRVAPGTWAPISIAGKTLTIESFGGASVTTISGGGTQRAVTMSNIAADGVVLSGFSVRNGAATEGGGIKLTNASPHLIDCVIANNSASGAGGGVHATASAPFFERCAILDNIAAQGGGAFLTGLPTAGGFALFDQCSISSNDSSGAGAGIYNAAALVLTGCQVLANTAGSGAGGLQTIAGASSGVSSSRFCLNLPANTTGAFSDLGGNLLGDDCNANGVCDLDEIAAGAEDSNGNNKLDECELARGDLNLDGVVNAFDLSGLLNFWGAVNPPIGDLNGDGVISGFDLGILLNNWGT